MKKFLPLLMLLAAVFIVSCKSSTDTATTGGQSAHGVDASGNVWMTAPPAGEGLQIAVEPFDVPAGTEVQGDFYFHLPSDVDFDVDRIEIAMNQGTHHMNMYRSKIAWPPDSGVARPMVFTHLNGKVDTVNIRYQAEFLASIIWNESDMLVEAQIPYLNWKLPTLATGEQSVVHFGANDTLIAENHFVNIDTLAAGGSQSTPNGKGKFIINLWKSNASTTTRASMIFSRKKSIKITPFSDLTFSKDITFSPSDIVRPISVLGMTGHYHSRGKRFWVDKMKGFYDANGNKTGDTVLQANVYQSIAWDEPPFSVYDPPVQLNAGEYLRMSAEYVNNSANTFLFGPHVKTDEHFNLFTWFTPSWHNGQTIYDDLE